MRSGALFPEDGAFLREAAERHLSLDECVPFRFSLPASPARAAAMEGRNLKVSDVEEHVRALAEDADLTVVEGAGGLMVPIQDRLMMIDLAERLGYPTTAGGANKAGDVESHLAQPDRTQGAWNERRGDSAVMFRTGYRSGGAVHRGRPGPSRRGCPGGRAPIPGSRSGRRR